MNLSNLQNAVYKYIQENPLLLALLRFSKVLVLLYPMYSILNHIFFNMPVLSSVFSIIGNISAVYYALYLIGLLLCFAKREMIFIAIAFWIQAVLQALDLINIISLFRILWIAFYGILGFLAFRNICSFNTDTTRQ